MILPKYNIASLSCFSFMLVKVDAGYSYKQVILIRILF